MPRLKPKPLHPDHTEISILGRVLGNGAELTPSLARHILQLGFDEADTSRINDLAARNQHGALSASERDELQGYADAGCLLGILHAKARRVIRKSAKRQ